MGACSKKQQGSRYIVKPEMQLRTEDSNQNSMPRLPAVRTVPTEEQQADVDNKPSAPPDPAARSLLTEPSPSSPTPALIHHYEDPRDLLKRYELPPEEAAGPKKKSMIVPRQPFLTPIVPVSAENSFESSESMAEGVVGTVL